jgi:ferritin-like metal-binding protein YciE
VTRIPPRTTESMTHTLEISAELKERLDDHLEEGQSHEEFIEELVSMYETDGAFLQEGYSE